MSEFSGPRLDICNIALECVFDGCVVHKTLSTIGPKKELSSDGGIAKSSRAITTPGMTNSICLTEVPD